MSNDQVSLEEFLKHQSTPRFTATIEALEGKSDLVKVTPWTAISGQCMCHLAINVRKSAIESVTPTGDTHICCGKTLKIVELHFKKGETLATEDVFNQLSESAHKSKSGGSQSEEGRLFSNPMPGHPYWAAPQSARRDSFPVPRMRYPASYCELQREGCVGRCPSIGGLPDWECVEACNIGYQACLQAGPPPQQHCSWVWQCR